MKYQLKSTDFDFQYTGNQHTEKELIDKGYAQLTGEELLKKINNKLVFGDYLMGYKFATEILENGTVEGINNAGTPDFGKWKIDFNKHTLQLEWKGGWANTETRAYDVNGNIEFFDSDTGFWRTTFKIFKELLK